MRYGTDLAEPVEGLLHKLRALGRAAEDATNGSINYGGCGVYAAAVAKRLEALGLEVECVTPVGRYGGAPNISDARANLLDMGVSPESATAEDWWEAGVCGYHVGVRFMYNGRWYTHDTSRTLRGRDMCGGAMKFNCTEDGLTPDEAHAMASDERGWNSRFDREFIPDVRELVEEYLR